MCKVELTSRLCSSLVPRRSRARRNAWYTLFAHALHFHKTCGKSDILVIFSVTVTFNIPRNRTCTFAVKVVKVVFGHPMVARVYFQKFDYIHVGTCIPVRNNIFVISDVNYSCPGLWTTILSQM